MSVVTNILTGRINLRRDTSYLLDSAAIAASLSLTRQPLESVVLEIELDGNTVQANGRVTVFTTAGAGVAQYVVTDRTTGAKWAIKISDGVINIVSSASSASAEPIVQDSLVPGNYWKIFVNDGVIGIEFTGIVQNDSVLLNDTVTSTTYRLIVSDGVLGITQSGSTSEVFTFSENIVKIGSTQFASVSGLTTSGIAAGFIKVRAVNNLGQYVNQRIVVSNSVPVRFYSQKGRIRMQKAGQESIAEYKMMGEPDLDIRNNDIVIPTLGVPGITIGILKFVKKIYDFDGATHHVEADIMDL